jgi:hypothetical protein
VHAGYVKLLHRIMISQRLRGLRGLVIASFLQWSHGAGDSAQVACYQLAVEPAFRCMITPSAKDWVAHG